MTSIDDTYQRAGFGGAVERGSRPALLVVDLTRGFTEAAFPTGADMSATVARTATLVDACRIRQVPVIFTAIAYRSAREARTWHQKAPGLASLVAGSPSVELDPRLPVRPDDVVIVKHGASAFFGTDLAALLTSLHVDTLVVCGATTSGCVRATVVDAVQHGFPTLVPRGCVADRAEAPHDASIFDIQAKYADVISDEDALSYLTAERCPTAER